MRHLVAPALCAALLAGCSSHPPARPEVAVNDAPPAGIVPAVWRDVRGYPADVAGISAFPAGSMQPLVDYFRAATDVSCFQRLAAQVDRYYMADLVDRAGAVLVLHGAAERAAVEACAAQFLERPVEREGDLTVLRSHEGGVEYLGWIEDGDETIVVSDGDPAVVRRFLARPGGIAQNAALIALLGGVDTSMGVWMAQLRDYGALLGVSSRGIDVALRTTGPVGPDARLVGRVRLHFDDATAASRALDALRARIAGEAPETRAVLDDAITASTDAAALAVSFDVGGSEIAALMQVVQAYVAAGAPSAP